MTFSIPSIITEIDDFFIKILSAGLLTNVRKMLGKKSSHLHLGNQSSALHVIKFLYYKLYANIICYYIKAQMGTCTLGHN